MQDEALDHWDAQPERRRQRRRDWWNRLAARDFMLERELDLVAINELLLGQETASKPKRSRRRTSSPARNRRRTR
jgi:hypothetical protein